VWVVKQRVCVFVCVFCLDRQQRMGCVNTTVSVCMYVLLNKRNKCGLSNKEYVLLNKSNNVEIYEYVLLNNLSTATAFGVMNTPAGTLCVCVRARACVCVCVCFVWFFNSVWGV